MTDFEELAVYDCSIKPAQSDSASKGRLSFYTYEDYVEKWDEIESIFSKQAILKGSFDRFASKKKRGTSTVAQVFFTNAVKISKKLGEEIALKEYEKYRKIQEKSVLVILTSWRRNCWKINTFLKVNPERRNEM